MRTVTSCVSSREDTKQRPAAGLRGEPQGALVSFISIELLWRVPTPRRWGVLTAMTSQGKPRIRAVGRDVQAMHGDVTALVLAGHVHFTNRQAA